MIKKIEKKSAITKAPVVKKTEIASKAKRISARELKKQGAPKKPAKVIQQVMDEDTALAFAMSIAEQKKAAARATDEEHAGVGVRLTRRPTTRSKGENTVHFSKDDLADFRRRLLEARSKALSGVNAMKATGFNEAEDHEADGGDGTNQTLRLQALGQMGVINRTIRQIEEALHRIDDGSYGVCTVCGKLIRKQRLLNQPFVLTCMECQTEMERVKNLGR